MNNLLFLPTLSVFSLFPGKSHSPKSKISILNEKKLFLTKNALGLSFTMYLCILKIIYQQVSRHDIRCSPPSKKVTDIGTEGRRDGRMDTPCFSDFFLGFMEGRSDCWKSGESRRPFDRLVIKINHENRLPICFLSKRLLKESN